MLLVSMERKVALPAIFTHEYGFGTYEHALVVLSATCEHGHGGSFWYL